MLTTTAALVAVAAEEASKDGPPKPSGPPPAKVRVAPVIKQRVQNKWQVVGRLIEVRRSHVAAERDGRVIKVSAEQGDRVVGGKTVLARTDDTWTQLDLRIANARLAQAKAQVAESQSDLDQAKRHFQFLSALSATKVAKRKEVDDASDQVTAGQARQQNAQATVLEMQASIDRRREELTRHVITAPFDGVVIQKLTEVGQWLSSGDVVAEIISTGSIDAVINVPERYINVITVGDTIDIAIEPLRRMVSGKVVSITPMGSTAARTFPVKVRIDDQDGDLKAGMSVAAYVPTGDEAERLTVPRDAVIRNADRSQVWLNLKGKAMPVGVKVLFGAGKSFVIQPVGGPPLMPGMEVVIEGAERLFPTQPLIVQQSIATTAANP